MLKTALVLVLILHVATAFTIHSYNVTFDVQDAGSARQTVQALLTPDTQISQFDIEVSQATTLIYVACEPTCTHTLGPNTATLLFEQELAPDQHTQVTLVYDVPNAVIEEAPDRLFIHTFRPDSRVDDFQLKLVLPLRAVLSDTTDPVRKPTIFPNAAVSSDGKRIDLTWNVRNLAPGSEHIFLTRYTTLSDPTLFLLAPVLILAGAGIVYYTRRTTAPVPANEKPATSEPTHPTHVEHPAAQPIHAETEKLSAVLTPDENRTLELIKATPGIQQNKLVRILGFNKVKASRVISRLENAKLIRKERAGITNELYLA